MWRMLAPGSVDTTSCGRIRDGILAYRLAGLPLALLRLADSGRNPAPGQNLHERGRAAVRLLARLPFLAAGLLLGGSLWWVTRRLYGNRGGYTALVFYCFSPAMLHSCAAPDADALAALALYSSVYTAIGVAHAMHGPRRKWSPRLLLLLAGFGCAATAHIAALPLAALLGLAAMLWITEGRWNALPSGVLLAAAGALALLLACYGFSLDATGYALRAMPGMLRFSLDATRQFFGSAANAGLTLAACAAVVLYWSTRKSRYFGNTVPLLCALVCLVTIPAGSPAGAWLWAQPFLFTFVGGVFADAYESRHGRWAVAAAAACVTLQAAVCLLSFRAPA